MTAREIRVADVALTVSGAGYSTVGQIRTADGSAVPERCREALVAAVLCSDSDLRDGEVVGDPTEGALLVLAEKGGVEVAEVRRQHPRLREVPFDSEYKFMASFHRWTTTTAVR
jgi:Ca2+-transporting ATPase